MSRKPFEKKLEERSARWADSLVELARERGDSDAVANRAVQLSRQLNISPWIALAVAERLISLQEAQIYDRVGRCRELQAAVLDKGRPMEELRVTMPYAPHFLAMELMDQRPSSSWDVRVVVRILAGVLGAEQRLSGDEPSLKVRTRPIAEYAAAVERVMAIMRRTRCDVNMALDVEAGRTTEQFAGEFMQQKRALEAEERRLMTPPHDDRFRFPPRRAESGARRPVFHHGEHAPHPPARAPRDHWPK